MIEKMKQWLEALEHSHANEPIWKTPHREAITSLRQAIEQAEKQEPVALQMDVIVVNLVREGINKHRARELAEHFIKHTTPQPQREWVGLTDEEINEVLGGDIQDEPSGLLEFVRALEAKVKELNT